MVAKFTTPHGMIAVLGDDWRWHVTLPEGMPPELARLAEDFIADGTPTDSPGEGDAKWIVMHFASGFGGTYEINTEYSRYGNSDDADIPDR